MSGPAVAAQEFDLHGIWRKEFDDSAHIAGTNFRIVRAGEHRHQIQQIWLSRSGHVINRW